MPIRRDLIRSMKVFRFWSGETQNQQGKFIAMHAYACMHMHAFSVLFATVAGGGTPDFPGRRCSKGEGHTFSASTVLYPIGVCASTRLPCGAIENLLVCVAQVETDRL